MQHITSGSKSSNVHHGLRTHPSMAMCVYMERERSVKKEMSRGGAILGMGALDEDRVLGASRNGYTVRVSREGGWGACHAVLQTMWECEGRSIDREGTQASLQATVLRKGLFLSEHSGFRAQQVVWRTQAHSWCGGERRSGNTVKELR